MQPKSLVSVIEEGLNNADPLIDIPQSYCYLSEQQAKNTDEALQLVNDPFDVDNLSSHIQQFVESKHLAGQCTLVDLGIGPGLTPQGFHQAIISNLKMDAMVGIDASENVLKILEKTKDFQALTSQKKLLNKTFEELIEDPSLVFQEVATPQALFLFLGFTFSNFTKEFVSTFLGKVMRKNDCIAIIVPFIKDRQDGLERVQGKYDRDPELLQKKKVFNCTSLVEIGFDWEDFDFQFQFDTATFEHRGIATLQRLSKNIPTRLIRAGLKPGQKFQTILSRLFTLKTLQREMESFGFDVELHRVGDGGAIFALCQKTG